MFAQFGIPKTIVTGNGTGFVSQNFKVFLEKNRIRHVTSALHHPASNCLAERAVQVVKKGLKKVSKGSIKECLAKVLLSYRITPHTTTGVLPSELLLGRRPRTVLDLLKPHTADRVEAKQQKQKQHHDLRAKDRKFKIGDKIYYYNHGVGNKQLPGGIIKQMGPVSFHVDSDDGRHRQCHQDQLQARDTQENGVELHSDIPVTVSDEESIPEVTSTTSTTAVEEPIEHNTSETSQTANDSLLIGNRYPRCYR